MNDKAPTKPARPPNGESQLARTRRAAAVKLNPAFDSWLEDKLHRIFDAASTEPLPSDLVKLLDQIDTADAAKREKEKG